MHAPYHLIECDYKHVSCLCRIHKCVLSIIGNPCRSKITTKDLKSHTLRTQFRCLRFIRWIESHPVAYFTIVSIYFTPGPSDWLMLLLNLACYLSASFPFYGFSCFVPTSTCCWSSMLRALVRSVPRVTRIPTQAICHKTLPGTYSI